MKRPQYVFRPNLSDPQHRRAWALLQQVPPAKRKEFLVQSILAAEQTDRLEKSIRKVVREELQAVNITGAVPSPLTENELIAASIESSPVPIQISDSLPDGIQAQYVPKNRTIYVRNGMDAGTTLCAIVRECAQADFHKDYTYNRQAYAAPSYCAAYMVAHRYGLDTAAFNFDRVVALYGNLGKEQQRGFLSDVNTVGGGLLRSLSRTLAVQTRELPAAEYAVAVPPAKKPSRQQERG